LAGARAVANITISYRREDSGVIAGRIFDRLVAHYGAANVFRDIDNVPPGIDYRKYIDGALDRTDILLAIVGPHWSGKTTDGRTRIAEPTDLVRLEVETALRKDIPVIPILVANATMPQSSELPDALKDFAYRNALKVDAFEDFDDHVRRLIRSLDRLLQARGSEARAEEERKQAESQAKLQTEARRKAAEQAEAGGKAEKEDEKERREPLSAPLSPHAPRSATPELRQQLEHVSSEQAETAAVSSTVPWRVIAGSAIILGVIAIVAFLVTWPAGFTPQPAPPATSQPTPPVMSQPAPPVTPQPTPTMPEPAPAEPQVNVAKTQRAVLYEQDPNNPQGRQYVGSIVWRTEPVAGSELAPELQVRADITMPSRNARISWVLRRNTDQALPASHTIEITFISPNFSGSGGVANVPGVLMKESEQARAVPLKGLAVKVYNSSFQIGSFQIRLSAVDADVRQNMQLLKHGPWFEIPIVYNNGGGAILAMEKGVPGDSAFAAGFKAWGQ
jgi:TIR domain